MRLKNKCKNCGYSFTSGDGSICPECLFSREETMKCEDFHSHETSYDYRNANTVNSERGYTRDNKNKNSSSKTASISILVVIIILNVLAAIFSFIADAL